MEKNRLQIHMENKSEDGGKTNINKKEPYERAQEVRELKQAEHSK